MKTWAGVGYLDNNMLTLYNFLTFSGNALLVAGGNFPTTDKVEVLSLDSDNPVPSCLGNLNPFPALLDRSVGAMLSEY